jgi:amino acid permease
MAGAKASSRCELDDYSEITEKILGRKARVILNVILILYSYACMMCFLALIFPLFGRFIQSIAYNGKYDSYDDFSDKKWGKLYIKVIFYVIVSFAISMMCLIDDINKLNFSSYIGVGAVIYTLLIITYQCHGYYIYYKKNMYIEEDKNTHANYTDFSQAFKKDLDFFKGMANLFCAYACHPNIFPVYAGFKEDKEIKTKEEGLKKMSLGTIFATVLTTALHIVSIVCSFLTNPITPEDLIIYRKSKDSGKDIPMGIAKLAVFISLVFTLPIYYFTLRLSVSDSFLNGKITTKFNIIFTFCSIFGSSIVAIVYDKILNYLSYIGGFISVFICYLIPVLLYIKAYGKPITYWKNLLQFIFAIILCMIGVTAGILTIIDDVKG